MNRYRLCNLEWANHFHNLSTQKYFSFVGKQALQGFRTLVITNTCLPCCLHWLLPLSSVNLKLFHMRFLGPFITHAQKRVALEL